MLGAIMKRLLTILLLFPLLAFPKASLYISLHSCNIENFGTTNKISIYKNGVFLYEKSDSSNILSFVHLTNLDTGLYQIHYQNIFHKEVYSSKLIPADSSYFLEICLDKFGDIDKSFHGLIDSISDTEPLVILVNSVGCYGNAKSELKIEKTKGKIFAYYTKTLKTKGEKKSRIYKAKELTESDINQIRQFEYELNLISNSNTICSYREYYKIESGAIKKSYFDSTCKWTGIWKLVKFIF